MEEPESLKKEIANFKKEIKMLEDHMEEAERLRQEVANLKKEIKKLEDQQTINERIKDKIQKTKKLEEEGNLLRKKLDEETIKTKFENSSTILDDILRSQKTSNDKTLGYDNERKSKCSSLTNRERNNSRGCANVLKSPIKNSQNSSPSTHYNDKTGMIFK